MLNDTNIKFIGDLSAQDASVLQTHGKASKNILEFGAGGSTQIFSQCCPETLVSVETCSSWIEVTNRRIEELTVPHTSPIWTAYGEHPIKKYDLIFVDGIDEKRLDFALSTWSLLSIGGVMLFHDTRRERDARNAFSMVSSNFNEIRLVAVNENNSNITVIHKGERLPYVNWQQSENLPIWRYGTDHSKSIRDILD